jgi:hypothetical protein
MESLFTCPRPQNVPYMTQIIWKILVILLIWLLLLCIMYKAGPPLFTDTQNITEAFSASTLRLSNILNHSTSGHARGTPTNKAGPPLFISYLSYWLIIYINKHIGRNTKHQCQETAAPNVQFQNENRPPWPASIDRFTAQHYRTRRGANKNCAQPLWPEPLRLGQGKPSTVIPCPSKRPTRGNLQKEAEKESMPGCHG